jgi:putative heme-binding domain-containing protein
MDPRARLFGRCRLSWFAPAILFIALCAGPALGDLRAQAVDRVKDDPVAIELGGRSYRGRCARCHGNDARGIQGPDLTASVPALGDAALFRIVRFGIPGTEMPGTQMTDVEVAKIVAYLRTLGGTTAPSTRGDPAVGSRVFWDEAGCGRCHFVLGRGGHLGPDLSRIGSARTRSFLVAKIRNPSERVTRGWERVTVTANDGQQHVGVRRNEDTFSIQILDTADRLRFFWKDRVRGVNTEQASLMPAYPAARLSESALDDLLSYLATLRGSTR